MITRFLLTVCLLIQPAASSASELVQLHENQDASLVHILNDIEIITERRDPADRTFPYLVRIIRLRSHGECNGKPETCPKETVYIAISSWDEYPEQKVYQLPEAYGWDFHRWTYLPHRELPKEFVVFEMKRKIVADDKSKGWWSEQYYEIKANIFSAAMRELP